jgi:membrane-bound lytic murein transglycosylase MltF
MQIGPRWLLGLAFAAGMLAAATIGFQRSAQVGGTEATEASPPTEAGSKRGPNPGDRDEGTTGEILEQSLLDLVHTPWTGDLDGMLERRLIRLLTVPSETMYFLEKGKPRGIVVEVRSAFETFINKRFPPQAKHLKTNVAVVPTRSDDLLPALLDGRGDIAASNLTITPEREGLVDFSDPVSNEVHEIAVTGTASPQIAGLDDLAGKEVLVRPSSSYWEHLKRLNQRFASEGKEPVKLQPAPEELEDADLLEMVNAGLVEIVVVDDYKAELWAKVLPDIRPHPDAAVNRGGRYGWMMRRGSPLLQRAINAFIEDHKQGTAFGNTVIKRYLGSTQFVRRATSPAELGKFDEVVDLFRQHGEQYTLDPLLLMAQAYQESQLDHRARSPSGAVGIMQVMPSTSKEMNVGDVHQLGPNIHAGTKYIRLLIDRYFDDDSLDDLNKALFAFAAYNAGPNRILRLREAANERGLDPDTWFDNVELVVSEKVGAEPVTYVSNIFKYYVGFKLLEQHRESQRQAKEAFGTAGQ